MCELCVCTPPAPTAMGPLSTTVLGPAWLHSRGGLAAWPPGGGDWGASGTITLCSQSPCAGHTFLVRGHHGQSLRKKPPHSHKEPWRARITFRRFQLQI